MIVPDGMTEEQVVEAIQKVAKRLAYKYRFGYHTVQDIEQEAFILVLKPDTQGKTLLEKYDGKRPLENFLWTHLRNRLYNFKRDNYERIEKPCFNCPLGAYIKDKDKCKAYHNKEDCDIYAKWLNRNNSKKNLMNPVEWSVVNTENENDMHCGDDLFDNIVFSEMLGVINDNIKDPELRRDWIKLQHGIALSKHRKAKIKQVIIAILQENGFYDRESEEEG